MIEIWKTIEGWPNYQVSSLGRIKRLAGRDTLGRFWPERIKQQSRKGYITLTRGKRTDRIKTPIARLVLIAFVGQPPIGKNEACHKDDIRTNNALSNLYWGDSWDNHQDRKQNGRTGAGKARPFTSKPISEGNRRFRKASGSGMYTIFSETKLLCEWLEDPRCPNVKSSTFLVRVRRGWSLGDALTRPTR